MKIAHFVKCYYPDTWGGVEEVIHQLCLMSQANGIQADVITLADHDRQNTETTLQGYTIRRFPCHFKVHSAPFSFKLFTHAKSLLSEYDLVHFHFPWPFADLLCVTNQVPCPSIVTYHADAVSSWRWLERAYRELSRKFLTRVDKVIATSPKMAESSVLLSEFSHKTSVIPLGLEPSSYPDSTPELTRQWQKRLGDSPFILFVGVLRHYKGLRCLMEAAESTQGNLCIVGGGPRRGELEKLIKCRRLNNVKLLGQLDVADKMTLFRLARAAVLPSNKRSEAFGIVLLEAMMMGTPIISTELGTGTSYVNQHNQTGFVIAPDSPAVLASAMNRLLNDDALANSMGKQAKARFEQHFLTHITTRQYLKCYLQLVHGKTT